MTSNMRLSKNILSKKNNFLRRVQSFVRRDGRLSQVERDTIKMQLMQFGLRVEEGLIDFSRVFQREAACMLEIGFGSGESLLAAAKANPDHDFIGIEMYLPGIGKVLKQLEEESIKNIRIYYADAVAVIDRCIPENSLTSIHIFFPDPWPKRRHHKRRLIQLEFVKKMVGKLKVEGTIQVATDWEDYAIQMMTVFSSIPTLQNTAGNHVFSKRSEQRPVVTKFEYRGEKSGRRIFELKFFKVRKKEA